MSSEGLALRVEGVSKCYQIYEQKHHRLLQTLLGDRKRYYKEFWALREIGFEVAAGECIGIIGRNGSGKSTLLQIIAGTLAPTTGRLEIRGRVAALLELGSGFNPEFTGRENVYLNGAVLGLVRREIDAKFDQIAAFADIGEFIEQPVKTYSSGMVVRLAFAVQVAVEPEFLIVDEALAVGDAAFQMKCMTRMQQLIDRGTTVLFVTHSVQTVRTFCQRAVWLDRGRIREIGGAAEVCSRYVEFLFSSSSPAPQTPSAAASEAARRPIVAAMAIDHPGRKEALRRWGSGEIAVTRFSLTGDQTGSSPVFRHLERLGVFFEAEVRRELRADMIAMAVALRDARGIDIVAISSAEHKRLWTALDPGETVSATFEFDMILNPGEYMLVVAVEYFIEGKRQYSDYIENACLIEVVSDRRHYGLAEPRVDLSIERSPPAST